MKEKDNQEKRLEGRKTMDAVYGKGFSERLKDVDSPIINDTLEHLFAEIWSRPGLSIRDRRLLIMGATAAAGKGDRLVIQASGALKNNELSPTELREAALHLAYYVGWEKGTEAAIAFEEAIAKLSGKI